MRIKFSTCWNNPNNSAAMTAYNLGMLHIAAKTENVMYILAKFNELYTSAKKGVYDRVIDSNKLIDDVVYKLLKFGKTESNFNGWPTIYGPNPDGYIPDIRNIKIERAHLIKALTPNRFL